MHVAIATLTSGIGGGLSEKYIYLRNNLLMRHLQLCQAG
jgi:hypothetical protein